MSVSIGLVSTDRRNGSAAAGKGRGVRALALSTVFVGIAACAAPLTALAQSAPTNYQVFFDFDHADLTARAVEIVDEAAANAAAGKVTNIDVTGYTDTVGSEEYNMRLS